MCAIIQPPPPHILGVGLNKYGMWCKTHVLVVYALSLLFQRRLKGN